VKVDLEAIHETWVGFSKVEDSLKVSESGRGRIEVVESVPRILASMRSAIQMRRSRQSRRERERVRDGTNPKSDFPNSKLWY